MANKRKPVTMEEMNRNWDDWWNSLTDSQKQKLVEEQEAMEKQRLENEKNTIYFIMGKYYN